MKYFILFVCKNIPRLFCNNMWSKEKVQKMTVLQGVYTIHIINIWIYNKQQQYNTFQTYSNIFYFVAKKSKFMSIQSYKTNYNSFIQEYENITMSRIYCKQCQHIPCILTFAHQNMNTLKTRVGRFSNQQLPCYSL